MARKFMCPNCNEVFTGKLTQCPKCGVTLHYLNENETKKDEESEKSNKPTFNYDDRDVLKNGINDISIDEKRKNLENDSLNEEGGAGTYITPQNKIVPSELVIN